MVSAWFRREDRNHRFSGQKPRVISLASDPVGGHEFKPVLREKRPSACGLGPNIDKAGPCTFGLPYLHAGGTAATWQHGYILAPDRVGQRIQKLPGLGTNFYVCGTKSAL